MIMDNCTVSFHESEMANATPAYKPLLVQKVVATIMCAMVLIVFFLQYSILFFKHELFPEISLIVFDITLAICFAVLIKFANNKATRIALAIGVAVWMFWNLRDFLHYCYIDIPDSIEGILSEIDILLSLALIYFYSLIIRNNTLSTKNRMWINMLAVLTLGSVLSIFFILSNPFNDVEKVMGGNWLHIERNHYDSTLTYLFLIHPIRVILSAAAYWHFARCEVFSGKYDVSAKGDYSPLNKWMAMAVIAPAIMFLCIFLLYKNYELFI